MKLYGPNCNIKCQEEYKIKSIAWKNTIRDLNNKRKEFYCMESDTIEIEQETHELNVTFFKKTIDLLEGLHKDQLKNFMSLVERELEKTNENLKNILLTFILLTLEKKEKALK